MNNKEKFDMSRVCFTSRLQGVEAGCEGFFADHMSGLFECVTQNHTFRYGEISKIDAYSDFSFSMKGEQNKFRLFYLVKKPEKPRYRPFTWEDKEKVKMKWIKRKGGDRVEECIIDLRIADDATLMLNDKPADALLCHWEFLDGSPCGVEITEEK